MSAQEFSRPGLANVRALVTTRWKRGYSQRVISAVEGFFIDSSLDNDADGWEIRIGDPTGAYLAMLERNNEVRVELLTSTRGAAGHLMTGIADEISFTESGTLVLTGRDYASLALDSICPPVMFRKVQPKYVVSKQARELGFTNISLALNGQIKKMCKTDGSETYWEFWYRLYRNEKMWLWVGANGALIGNRLNYNAAPTYYFGTPMQTDPIHIQRQHIKVEGFNPTKSTQGRVETVMVYSTGKARLPMQKVKDPTMKDWMKKPSKLIEDTVSHSPQKVREKGWEEIFEGKVGSLEISLTVSEPGHVILPNKICRLRLPEFGYSGEFFIIGVKFQADSNGYVQQVRLREKQIALSHRVPKEPVIPSPNKSSGDVIPGTNIPVEGADVILESLLPENPEWAKYFFNAAREFKGNWDESLFLASIIGTAYLETGIRNIREYTKHHDNEIWRPWKYKYTTPTPVRPGQNEVPHGPEGGPPAYAQPANTGASAGMTAYSEEYQRRLWMEMFVNEVDQVTSMGIASKELGVGPMQLTSRGLKTIADDFMKPGFHDQYSAGRWHPEHNIRSGARYFAECLKATGISPVDPNITQQEAMWQAGSLYWQGPAGDRYSARHDHLRRAVLNDPGFLGRVTTTFEALRQNSVDRGNYATDGTVTGKILPQGWPNEVQALAAFQHGLWLGPEVTNPNPTDAGPPYAVLPPIKFLSAGPGWYSEGRGLPPDVRWIVIHTMEVPEETGVAAAVASAFATRNGPTRSAHYNLSDSEIYQSVRDEDTAYGVRGTASFSLDSVNAHSLHFEHAGYAGQSPAEWNDKFSQDMLRNSAMLTAQKAKKFNIPVAQLSVPQIQAGSKGFVSHANLSLAFAPSEAHSDPGANFPWTEYLALVNSYMGV